ncbi:MAG: hypothetical protein ABIP53_03105 [Candidatus Limnocylindrales bacterium]
MSRRHSSSRRRNYGRRQHEVRERRAGFEIDRETPARVEVEDWGHIDLTEERHELRGNAPSDGYDGAQL